MGVIFSKVNLRALRFTCCITLAQNTLGQPGGIECPECHRRLTFEAGVWTLAQDPRPHL